MERTFVIIDLFCGAGGTSFGFHSAEVDGKRIAEVLACVNHDALAIKSHLRNFPNCRHHTEDVRTLDVTKLPRKEPGDKRIWILWASLECTHFSNAKTGSRDADSRTLANALFPYIQHINPDLVKIENVREFMSWGPLIPKVVKSKGDVGTHCPIIAKEIPVQYGPKITKAKGHVGAHCKIGKDPATGVFGPKIVKAKGENGIRCNLTVVKTVVKFGPHLQPESKTKGRYYLAWRQAIEKMDYRYQSHLLNSADYGAYQSRTRYFAVFAKPDMPIIFPHPTHDRHGRNGLEKWKAVRAVLNLDVVGKSIFNRKKRLSDNTFRRVLAGLVKYVATGMDEEYLVRHYGGDPASKVTSIHSPAPTVTCIPHESLVQVKREKENAGFMIQYNGNPDESVRPITEPCGVLTTTDRFGLMACVFMDNQFGTGVPSPISEPCHALTTVPKSKVVTAKFGIRSNGGHPKDRVFSLARPLNTLTTSPNQQIVTVARFPWILTNMHQNSGSSVDVPAPTLLTGTHHYLLNAKFRAPFLMPTNYSNEPTSVDAPCPTITANRKHTYLVNPKFVRPAFLDQQFGQSKAASLDSPCGAVTTNPKYNFVSLLMNPQFGWPMSPINQPCFTLIAKMDKKPPYLVSAEPSATRSVTGTPRPEYYADTTICPEMRIRAFMEDHGIEDIFMRMLDIPELKQIQGFPIDYILLGPKDQQKKFIGNAVVPQVVAAWAIEYFRELNGMNSAQLQMIFA